MLTRKSVKGVPTGERFWVLFINIFAVELMLVYVDNVLYYIFSSCLARYECEESFTTLNVDIRNHQNLLDSMEQYVKGDLLEGANAYHCEKCNKKVRTRHCFI